jgi:hypothetical protein
MKFPVGIPVYGDKSYRGASPSEKAEQVTFFTRIRTRYPDTYGALAFHPRNEGKKSFAQVNTQKAEGMTPGASDIIIPGKVTFVCELKQSDHTNSKISKDEIAYLYAAQEAGAFACIALGVEGAWLAFHTWRELYAK